MESLAKWTFMVFMAGDNNLSSAGDKDLREMRSVGSSRDVNIVVEFDNEGSRGTSRYRVGKNGRRENVVRLGETDCGSPQVLNDFIAWAAQKYPAEHYALVLWSHGSAWEPAELDRIARQVNAPNYSPKEAVERSATHGRVFFRTTHERIFQLPNPSERAICVDDGSGHSLDTIELGHVLAKAVQSLGQPVDLLGMDACLMSNIEVAYQARPFVRHIVASEESEPNDGWPYDRLLSRLRAEPQMSPAALASHIVSDYVQSYTDIGYPGSVTQSAFDLSKIDQLTGPIDDLADAVRQQLPDIAREMWGAQRRSARFWHDTLWDVAHFSEELAAAASGPVCDAAQAARAAVTAGPEKFIIAEAHNGSKVARCGGVTIYLPAMTSMSRFYSELDYARDHRWAQMLAQYQNA